MYYREKIIDGVYYYKNDPKGDWTPLNNKNLTSKIIAMQKLIDEAY
jgi:hypothetical protein